MKTIVLSASDLAIAASLVLVDAGLSLALHLDLHRRIAFAALRMTVQLVAVGYVLRFHLRAEQSGGDARHRDDHAARRRP